MPAGLGRAPQRFIPPRIVSPLFIRMAFSGIASHRYLDNRRAQELILQFVAALQLFHNFMLAPLRRIHGFNRLMQVGVKQLAGGLEGARPARPSTSRSSW